MTAALIADRESQAAPGIPCANLLADPVRRLLAKVGGAGPIRIGADYRKPGVAPRENPKMPMRSRSMLEASGDAPTMKSIRRLMSFGPLDVDRKIVGPAQIQDGIAGMIDGCNDKSRPSASTS